jgi:hypothetical protein
MPQITMNFAKADEMKHYGALGIDRCVFAIPTGWETNPSRRSIARVGIARRFGDGVWKDENRGRE